MAKKFIQDGRFVELTATSAVKSGAMVVAGLLCGVAQADAAVGEPVVIDLGAVGAVYEVDKTNAQEWEVGDAVYYSKTTKKFSNASAAGTLFVGVALAAAANPSPNGIVRFNGSMPPAAQA